MVLSVAKVGKISSPPALLKTLSPELFCQQPKLQVLHAFCHNSPFAFSSFECFKIPTVKSSFNLASRWAAMVLSAWSLRDSSAWACCSAESSSRHILLYIGG